MVACRVLQATRVFHTGQPRLAPLPPLPEYGGKVRLGLIPEEFFQFLYPKTGVTGEHCQVVSNTFDTTKIRLVLFPEELLVIPYKL